MEATKKTTSENAFKESSLLDSLHAAQNRNGYLTAAAMKELAEAYGKSLTQIYETASFYSMFRFSPAGKNVIQICRNAPCHIAGAEKVISAFEEALGIPMGTTSSDGKFTLEYVECLGQCQGSPNVMINGILHTNVTANEVGALISAIEG